MERLLGLAVAAAAVALAAGDARAQLIVTNDDSVFGSTRGWHVDLDTCAATPLWQDEEAWGCAADDANAIIWSVGGYALARRSYFSPDTLQFRFIRDSSNNYLTMVSLAFAEGKLYGTRNVANEAVYEINTVTGLATVVLDYPDGDFDLGGLGYNPLDGLFYATNDDISPFGGGIFSLDVLGGGAIAFVTAYDGGEIDVDGCAVGDGKVFAITDDAGDPLYNYELATATWDPAPCPSPMPTTEVFSGAAWAPSFGCNLPSSYCVSKTTSVGCSPWIRASGWPHATGDLPFEIQQLGHTPGKFALLFYSKTGRHNVPFQGGTLCAAPPVRRTPGSISTGSGTCGGVHTFDFHAWIVSGVDPALVAGQRVWAQWWGRDTPGNPSLSNGLEIVLCR